MRGLLVAMLCFGALPATASAAVSSENVTFNIRNVNNSSVLCGTNGQSYQVQGSIVGPAGSLSADGGSATLYLHGLGFGDFFWDFNAPGYDYAGEMASLGHVSVIIDRLGYAASDHPRGFSSCLGGQATIAHQIVRDLYKGSYAVGGGGSAVTFGRVALVGHSIGGAIAQIEAYSFHDVDALGVLSYADQGQSVLALTDFGVAGLDCVLGGVPSDGTPGYAPFGATAADFDAAMFYNADPSVVALVNAERNPDPCGDDTSAVQTIATDQLLLPLIHVPVLLLAGANDALFPPLAMKLQRLHFFGSHDVTSVQIPATGHAVTLGRTAPTLVDDMSAWLGARGF
jgi:pimeloyl-ACP methyl ester carboxylesterase